MVGINDKINPVLCLLKSGNYIQMEEKKKRSRDRDRDQRAKDS